MILGKRPALMLTRLQRELAGAPRDRVVFLGGPGSGKTTVLAERAAWLITSGTARPEEVLILAPSRRAATAVQRQARRNLGGRPGPEALSFHGLALTLLRRHYAALGYTRPPNLLGSADLKHVLHELLHAEDPTTWGQYGPALHSQVMRTLAGDTVVGAAENGLDERELRRRGEGIAAGTPLRQLAGFYGRYRAHLRGRGLLDFGTLLALAGELLRDHPEIAAQYRAAYRSLLVDEFEQANHAQAELLFALAGPGADLLLAGDPGQGINSYQGGSPSYLLTCAAQLGARVVKSDEDYRAAPRLGEARRGLCPPPWEAAANTAVEQDDEAVAGEASERGAAVLRPFTYAVDEARWVAVEVASLVHAGTPPEQVAIVCRSLGSPLVGLVQAELSRRGLPFVVPGAQGVLNEPLLRATVDLLRYLSGGEERDEPLLRLLDSPLAELPPFGLAELRRAAALARLTLPELLAGGGAPAGLSAEVAESVSALRARLESLAGRTEGNMAALLWELWRLFPAFAADGRGQGKASRAYAVLLEEVARLEEGRRSLSLRDLLERLERGDFDGLAAPEARETGVTITTVHAAKGREWDVVFLPALCEGAFPLRRSPLDIVAPLLLRDLPVGDEDLDAAAVVTARHIAEERRIFRVAVTRARRQLYLSFSRYDADGTTAQLPSRFLDAVAECPAIEVVPGEWREELPLHPAGAVAHYRAKLRAEDPLPRAQAVYALHRLREARPETVRPEVWWQNVAETAGGAPAFPGGQLYLSASRLGSYRECPLAYQYAYHWRLYEPVGAPATIGSILHATLEAYHRPGTLLARSRETLGLLLDQQFRESDFPYRPIASQARRTLEKMLDLYYGRYGLDGAALAVEQPFRFAFGPHVISGYIDRVDRLPAGDLELIDYKSGSAMTKADAEGDLQLALYDLACHEDESARVLGQPSKVSYLYVKEIKPRADGKRSYAPTQASREYLQRRVSYYAAAILAERFPSHFELAQAFADLEESELDRLLRNYPCRYCGWKWLCPWLEKGARSE